MSATQLRSILAATDLTEASDAGVNGAAPTFQGRIARAEEKLGLQLRRTLPAGVHAASREVVIYLAHRAILERAAAAGAGVIVLGPHRGRARADRLLGTTADRVIRSSSCPCLVVRTPLALPLRRVVVPLDLSDLARGALATAVEWALDLGRRDGDAALPEVEVDVVHVVPPSFASAELPVNRATVGPRLHAQVEEVLAAHPAGPEVREELIWGESVAGEILRYAEERRAGLVVLATHGHGALKRALVGSVASAVARGAASPVLLVPPARWDEDDRP